MKILLPCQVTETLREELRRAGRREIGGVLVGEHVDGETFRIVDISVQRSGGSLAHFVRDPAQHREFLDAFFEKTGHDYRRFNYFGEWHSHPMSRPLPSITDCETMTRIVADPDVGTNFAVLLVVRLHPWFGLQLSTTAFRPGASPDAAHAEAEHGTWRAGRFRELHMPPARKVKIL
jgi:integrative and conjugative element protein (TIGR02256 family)